MAQSETLKTYSKVRDEGPLLHRLVVCRLTSHQAEVKGQPRMVRTHDHGSHGGGCVNTNAIIRYECKTLSHHNWFQKMYLILKMAKYHKKMFHPKSKRKIN